MYWRSVGIDGQGRTRFRIHHDGQRCEQGMISTGYLKSQGHFAVCYGFQLAWLFMIKPRETPTTPPHPATPGSKEKMRMDFTPANDNPPLSVQYGGRRQPLLSCCLQIAQTFHMKTMRATLTSDSPPLSQHRPFAAIATAGGTRDYESGNLPPDIQPRMYGLRIESCGDSRYCRGKAVSAGQ